MTLKKINEIKNIKELIIEAEDTYQYQKNVTKLLDDPNIEITKYRLLEIVLWKLNRYPIFDDKVIPLLKELKVNYSKRLAKTALECLLNSPQGIDLPMASTILRFTRPDKFQIVDQRVYRLIMPKKNQLILPKNTEQKIELYFEYLIELKKVCSFHKIRFKKSDRLLYQLDKTINKSIKIKR